MRPERKFGEEDAKFRSCIIHDVPRILLSVLLPNHFPLTHTYTQYAIDSSTMAKSEDLAILHSVILKCEQIRKRHENTRTDTKTHEKTRTDTKKLRKAIGHPGFRTIVKVSVWVRVRVRIRI